MTFSDDPNMARRAEQAMQSMRVACMQLGLPHEHLQLMSRRKREVGICGDQAVFYFAPHHIPQETASHQWTSAAALTREGSIVEAVSAHFSGQPWKVPSLLARVETEEGIVHAHSFIPGKSLFESLGVNTASLQDQRGRDTLCRLMGRMLAHLHQTPPRPVMSNYPTYLSPLEPSKSDFALAIEWLSHGRCLNGGQIIPSICQSLTRVLCEGEHYLDDKAQKAFVHGDFQAGNIRLSKTSMGLIDFEYAGVADIHADFCDLFPFPLQEKQKIAIYYEQAGGAPIDLKKVAYFNCLELARYYATRGNSDAKPLIEDDLNRAVQTWEKTRQLTWAPAPPAKTPIFC